MLLPKCKIGAKLHAHSLSRSPVPITRPVLKIFGKDLKELKNGKRWLKNKCMNYPAQFTKQEPLKR